MTATTAVRARPLPFSDPMMLALMAGRKTQTRRLRGLELLNESPDDWALDRWQEYPDGSLRAVFDDVASGEPNAVGIRCPYGQPGDRLWVREAWQYADWTEDGEPFIRYRADGRLLLQDEIPEEWSDRLTNVWADLSKPENYAIDNCAADRRWRPGMFMPRWASRITLELTDVRVERLQEITEADIIAEGCPSEFLLGRNWFRPLWGSINAARGFGWDVNPWCWALTFKRVEVAS